MKKTIQFFALAMLGLSLVFTACNDDDDPVTPVDRTVTVSLTTQNNVEVDQWVYFSFETNQEVDGIDSTNYQTSDAWDIAFHSRHVRLNGGSSGQGQAAAYDAGIVDWESVLEAAETGYVQDTWVDSILFAGVGPDGPILIGTNLNPVFETAFTYDANTHPPTYLANGNVYVIRTRNGNYAKITLTDYYNELGESGYVTFKYIYNSDGSRKF